MNSKDLAELNKMYTPEMLSKLLAPSGSSSGSVANMGSSAGSGSVVNAGSTVNSGSSGSENKQIAALDANYKAQSDLLRAKYMTAVQQLNESRTRSKKEAGINHTKLMKYMPSIIKRQGLSGLGVSQSAVISANNNYLGALTDIENDYQKNSADLLANYNDAKLQYDTQYNTQKAQLEQAELDKQEAAKEKAEAKTAAEQANNYKNAYDIIVNDKLSTDFTALLETYKGIVSEADYNTLVQLAATQVAANQAAADEKTKGETEKTFEDNYNMAYNAIVNDTTSTDFSEYLSQFVAGTNIDEARLSNLKMIAAAQAAKNQEANNAPAKDTALTEIYSLYLEGKYEEANRILEANKDIINGSEYGVWKTILAGASGGKDEVDNPYDEMSEDDIKTEVLSGRKYVSFEGNDYRIKTDNKGNPKKLGSKANEIENNNDFKKQLSDRFKTNNPYDLAKIPDGTTLTIRCDATGANEVNWEDFLGVSGAIIDVTDWQNFVPGYNIYTQLSRWVNWETRTITFYDGQWYYSEDMGETKSSSPGATSKTAPSANSDPLGLYAQQWYSNRQSQQNGNNNLLNYIFPNK